MQRIIMALVVLGSFNVIAIQLFMAGNVGPLKSVLPYQQALLISAFFIVVTDIAVVYMMMTFKTGGKDFDSLFKKHYNGHNYEEAFKKAGEEYKKRF